MPLRVWSLAGDAGHGGDLGAPGGLLGAWSGGSLKLRARGSGFLDGCLGAPALVPPPRRGRARATAFDDCLCPVRGHCVPGNMCPKGEHVDSTACQDERVITYPRDDDFFRCQQDLDACRREWPNCKPKEKCKQVCDFEDKNCGDDDVKDRSLCEAHKKECQQKRGCKPERMWVDQSRQVDCADVCNEGCKLHVDDIKLEVKDRHILVKKVGERPHHLGIRVGSELVSIDDDMNGPWRGKETGVLHELDWSQGHKLVFQGPLPSPSKLAECKTHAPGLGQELQDKLSTGHLPDEDGWMRDPAPEGCRYVGGCGQGSVCCSMASARPEPSEEFVVKCKDQKHVCAPPNQGGCKHVPGDGHGNCLYQVQEM